MILGIELRALDFLDILRPFGGGRVEREGPHVIQASLKLRILLFPPYMLETCVTKPSFFLTMLCL